jgi:hypothetical protein
MLQDSFEPPDQLQNSNIVWDDLVCKYPISNHTINTSPAQIQIWSTMIDSTVAHPQTSEYPQYMPPNPHHLQTTPP